MSEIVSFKVSRETKEALKQLAQGKDISVSDVIRGAIRPYLDEREAEQWEIIDRLVKVCDTIVDRLNALDEKVSKLMVTPNSHTTNVPQEPKTDGGQEELTSGATGHHRSPTPKSEAGKSGATYYIM